MNYMHIVGQTMLILVVLTILLEFIGRKSVNHFSIIQVVVFISIGEVVLLPIFDDFKMTEMITVVIAEIAFLIIIEWLLLKIHRLESLLNKKAIVIVKGGKIDYKELKKQRMTVDQLEMKLRIKGIKNYEETEVVTLEGNGDIGFKYKEEFEPITKREMMKLLGMEVKHLETKGNDIFEEVSKGHSIEHNKKYY